MKSGFCSLAKRTQHEQRHRGTHRRRRLDGRRADSRALGRDGPLGRDGRSPSSPDPPSGAGTFYGDPEAAAPFWHYQDYDDDCVEMAVADVVGELTGDEPSEHAIVELAHSTPSISHSRTDLHQPGKRRAGERNFLQR